MTIIILQGDTRSDHQLEKVLIMELTDPSALTVGKHPGGDLPVASHARAFSERKLYAGASDPSAVTRDRRTA